MQFITETGKEPFIDILEQPQSKGFRFRYACEGKSHGGIQGDSSRKDNKTFPTIKLRNCRGPVKIVVSLVTDEEYPKPHAHELVGRSCENGVCTVFANAEEPIISFPNIGIKHITKKNVLPVLQERLREAKILKTLIDTITLNFVDMNSISLSESENLEIGRQAEELSKHIQLSVVRLQFQGYLLDEDRNVVGLLPPVYSSPIYDSKAPCASILKICRMDKAGGCCTGNEEVFLLCDKVQKEDIAVRFYEQDEYGNISWEDYGQFGPHDVHRQYAIVFRTPAYHDTSISSPTSVHIQLVRRSDGEVSDPKTFVYYPRKAASGFGEVDSKRKKRFHYSQEFLPDTQGNAANYSNVTFNLPTMVDECSDIAFRNSHENVIESPQRNQEVPYTASSTHGRDSFPSTLIGRGHLKAEASTNDSKDMAFKESTKARENDWVRKLKQLAECLQLYSCTEDVRFLISPLKSLIKGKNEDGDNSIHLSIIHNKTMAAFNLLSVLNSCVSRQKTLNDVNNLQQTPVFLSVLTDEPVHLKMLLECGCDVTHLTRDGDSLLHVAAKLNHHECLDLLLRKRSDQLKSIIDQFNFSGYTAVHEAAKLGNLKCLKSLVSHGADVQLRDKLSGKNALHHAIIGRHICTTAYLILETSIDVNAKTLGGTTALQAALASRQLEVADILLVANAEMVTTDDESSENSDSMSEGSEETQEITLDDKFSTLSIKDQTNRQIPCIPSHMTLHGVIFNDFDSGIESLRKDEDLHENNVKQA